MTGKPRTNHASKDEDTLQGMVDEVMNEAGVAEAVAVFSAASEIYGRLASAVLEPPEYASNSTAASDLT